MFSCSNKILVTLMGFMLSSNPAHAALSCFDALKVTAADLYVSKERLKGLKPAEQPEAGSLKTSFSGLWQRAKSFADKNSDRVKFVNQIRVRFEDNDGGIAVYEGHRNVMVISLKGLGAARKKFVEATLKMLGDNVVSFPLGEGAGHLYTQFRGRVYDSVGSLNVSNYEGTRSERLETLVVLNPNESKNLATYLKNAQLSPETTLGPFKYEGATKAKGELDDNRCRVGGHNCTSWLALAPIGENKETVMKLIQIPASTEWGTNPGYWSAGLMTRSNAQRTPFVIMWTTDSLDNFANRLVDSSRVLTWDFSAH